MTVLLVYIVSKRELHLTGGMQTRRRVLYSFYYTSQPTHVHKTHNIQYRIQNIGTHEHKITNGPVFYLALGLNNFDAGKSFDFFRPAFSRRLGFPTISVFPPSRFSRHLDFPANSVFPPFCFVPIDESWIDYSRQGLQHGETTRIQRLYPSSRQESGVFMHLYL
jgi:hypothetical protein